MRRRIEKLFPDCRRVSWLGCPAPAAGCVHTAVGSGVALPLPLAASRFYGVKGWAGVCPGGGGESLSPLWMGVVLPRTAESPVLDLVVAPLERRRGRRWRPTHFSWIPLWALTRQTHLPRIPRTTTPCSTQTRAVSRFLLLSFGDDAQGGIANPFHLHRAIARFGEAARVTKRSDGKVEIEMKAAESARKLLNSDSLSIQTKNSSRTVPITVRPHPTKGFATGVITVPDLEDVDEDDILEELRDQGVQRVRRLQRKENGNYSADRHTSAFFLSGNPPR